VKAKPIAAEVRTVWMPSSVKGTIGCRTRPWAMTNASAPRAASTSDPITSGEPKPQAPASIAPKLRPPMPSTAVSWPSQSSGAGRSGDAGVLASMSSAAPPTGTFTKKLARQLSSVSSPPRIGADDDATAHPDHELPAARPRAGQALSAVTDSTRALAPDLYLRYRTLFLDGIRADGAPLTPMPTPALSANQVHALMTQKRRSTRRTSKGEAVAPVRDQVVVAPSRPATSG